ncbi:hypothetical protein [Geobacter metallireducens]|uniref:hypothetical protein n=1 Tax=Geobacter metallireducens TaxID=28232 RepID=UPI0002E2752E|nr:hypothetical protein [Geobacter metallireducens]
MPADLDKIYILPKMRSEDPRNRFQLVWILNLNVSSSRCLIRLLFKNVKTGYYLADTIPPELLSYCTVGSYFAKGRKLIKEPALGTVRKFTVNSSEHNKIVRIQDALTDLEYDLSLTSTRYQSDFTKNNSAICKNQQCLVFHCDDMKIVIPCAVLAGVYYFKSTSLREAVFSQNLKRLHEDYSLDDSTLHAKITMKPGAADSDAKSIVRFLANGFAGSRMRMVRNSVNADSGQFQRLKVDFPVNQEITIKARGHLATNPEGGKTFVVFQVLEEDSLFPFDSITIDRRTYEIDDPDGDTETFPALTAKSGKNLAPSNPSSRYIRRILQNHVSIANCNARAIRENKDYIPTPRKDEGKVPKLMPGDKDVELSTQQDYPMDDIAIAKAKVERDDGDAAEPDDYSMPLDDFVRLVRGLKGYRLVNEDSSIAAVTRISLSRQPVWQRQRGSRKPSLRETYGNTAEKRRECAYVWFRYREKYVCLVEIDQSGLPSGCSTYVLISSTVVTRDLADEVVRDYVERELFDETQKSLRRKGIVLERKNHPHKDSVEHLSAWRNRLIEIIAVCAFG